ncbi:UDP-N-acetylmuramoyl-L-alanyl-D-glutamate--2,6-diaminopimelate ligase [Paraliomyxa miuraensis]|uniref:UDP-N-acetylmuramoyl-L-alanyl-D-glutamate--2, 6-diaminopimelate ligase n=1 Tax=Paraliomyxa miuraensis TaxID=376150 RepID=UPI0022574679|nr:UDP-N-acetylmuramoyl-L-alanyl-D-glutamate--2,6-diaminopimelate ligase [Paraliomyxa miuraensis]MCX4246086.1 UDP-N-acetylmuramoyl-L-alanyl-D-glutamate--2,6-diaminopimelate ligase [Paraliomyxa miuraensis]
MDTTLTLGRLLATIEPAPRYEGCGPDTPITALAVDSRTVEPGAAFLAVMGGTNDGHRFVEQARRQGAVVLIVQDDRVGPLPGAVVRLADTGAAYPELAANAYGRPSDELWLAGITGTNGKTTTAHLVGSALAQAGLRYARLGTTGNWLVDREGPALFTTPFPEQLQALLATAREREATHAVMEVSSHALVQGRVRPLRFTAVGLTSFSQDHLDFHADMDDYLDAKCRLTAEYLRDTGVAVAAVDAHPEAARRFLAAAPASVKRWRVSRGAVPDAEILAERVEPSPQGLRATLRTPAGTLRLTSPLVGAFNLDNLMVALGLCLGLGVAPQVVIEALATATGAPGRLQRVVVPEVSGPAVLVDYAHTPDAVARAIEAVRPFCRGRLCVVLGCGGDRDPGKRPHMGEVAARGADRFWATSDNPRTEDPEAIVDMMLAGVPADRMAIVERCVDRASAIAGAIAEASEDDLVLVAGKGHEDYQVLGTEKIHFDDREHARDALLRRR